jgi:cell wall-associated NlpC family hydrolase
MKKLFLLFLFLTSFQFLPAQEFIKQNKYAGDELFDFVREWWGTRYRYGGSTKNGIDCSAFTLKLFNNVYDIDLPRTASEQYRATKRISKSELKDGDLVFFRTRYKSGWHVGVYLTDGYFIHSKSKVGVAVDNLSNPIYSRMYYGAGRAKSSPKNESTTNIKQELPKVNSGR